MMIQYQRFQLGGRIEEIEVETVASIGKQYILLRDVQDVFPTAARFEREGRPVRFLSDEQGQRLEPWRIAVYPESTLQVIPQPTAKLPVSAQTASAQPRARPSPVHTPALPLLTSSESAGSVDWRDFLLQKGFRMAILILATMVTVWLTQTVYDRRLHASPFTMVATYWRVVTMSLFVLNVIWAQMLFFHVVQVVWFLVCVPLKARHSIYQSLFDIHV
ncbi:MAG: hypothetical protein JOS17DRAFT_755207 [Linnemannia elongata]|nr:MAG: hypothetical protein JOS17DRAFT_755207 [Linnemannia elongata]